MYGHNINLDDHNVTVDNFIQTSNTQRYNANAIFTIEERDKSDNVAETFKYLTINDTKYHVSDLANANDAKVNPASDLKTVTHTSDRNKRKFTDTSNGIFQPKIIE